MACPAAGDVCTVSGDARPRVCVCRGFGQQRTWRCLP
jgi:hypothetical protein